MIIKLCSLCTYLVIIAFLVYIIYIIMIILSFIVLEDCFQIYNVSRSMYYKWIDNGNGEHLCSWNVFAVYFVLYFPLLDPKVQ